MATRPTLYMFHFFRYYKNNVSFSFSLLVVTDHVSREGHAQSVPSVRPSVCLSVRLFTLYVLNRLTFERGFVCVRGHNHGSPRIEGRGNS